MMCLIRLRTIIIVMLKAGQGMRKLRRVQWRRKNMKLNGRDQE
jgi:hypothetical protein